MIFTCFVCFCVCAFSLFLVFVCVFLFFPCIWFLFVCLFSDLFLFDFFCMFLFAFCCCYFAVAVLFLSNYLWPHFQTEAWYSTIHAEVSLIFMQMKTYRERMSTRTALKKRPRVFRKWAIEVIVSNSDLSSCSSLWKKATFDKKITVNSIY